MLLCCSYCRASARSKTRENIADIWRHDVSVALRNHCYDMHAGPGICHTLLGDGCGIGIGVYADEVVLPILRGIYRVAGGGADWKRYGVECVVWRIAAHYRAATESESNFNVRHEQRGWRDGQNDRCAIDLHRHRSDQSGRQRRLDFPVCVLAFGGAGGHYWRDCDAVCLRFSAIYTTRIDLRSLKFVHCSLSSVC